MFSSILLALNQTCHPLYSTKFLSKIKEIKFIPEENQEPRNGFRYSIALFQEGELTFSFTLTEVNGHYYYTEPDLFPIVDNFYKTLDGPEE
jgi:hypothetical protein